MCNCCKKPIFDSEAKYDSGSGWPSFFKSFENVFETKTDDLLGYEEQSIIVKNVAVIMDIFLKMDQTLREKDFAIMVKR